MNQQERRISLIRYLLDEDPQYQDIRIPASEAAQKQLLRALMNVRMPKEADDRFLSIQDEYLKEELKQKGITDYRELKPVRKGIYLWQGDITTLACDAIVNAANAQMCGCFVPNHACIDNAIHTYAGIQLRYECAQMMKVQGHEEPCGQAKLTSAYNLPCRFVIHTIGPVVQDEVQKEDERMLASCYESCLKLADESHLQCIAFCCISTGVFHFPNQLAAKIAVDTVKRHIQETGSEINVIFNVFKDSDFRIYQNLLKADSADQNGL